jgi:zinc finger HIT domain-containing protein 1
MASFGLVKGSRIKEQRRVLDQASRQRRARKNLESLEQDNFHDDPHADLVMSKKALSLFQDHGGDHGGAHGSKVNKDKNRKKSRNAEYYKQRFRKNFPQLLEEDAIQRPDPPNYLSAQATMSKKPKKHLCSVCGYISHSYCPSCGSRYCCKKCYDTHKETRCMKYTA